MKTKFLLGSLAVLVFLSVVASAAAPVEEPTLIAGKIYTAGFVDEVEGATVHIWCGNVTDTTTSLSDGAYSVRFPFADCHNGMNVTVHANYTGIGENTVQGNIHNGALMGLDFDLGVVNVPLVPEFGLLIGTLTLAGAVGVFFVIRRQ